MVTSILLLLKIIFLSKPCSNDNSFENLNKIFKSNSGLISPLKKFSNNFKVMSFTSVNFILSTIFNILLQSSIENSGSKFPKCEIIALLIDWYIVCDKFHKICIWEESKTFDLYNTLRVVKES